MSGTPLTDAHYATTKTAWPTQADIDFARELERENARLREVIGMLSDAVHLSTGYIDERLWHQAHDILSNSGGNP